MEKEFCSYEQALALKELGFDEPCFGFYYPNGKLINIVTTGFPDDKKDCVFAPLYQQAFRWFRDKYGLEGVTQRAEDFMWYKWTIHQYNENSKKYVANWYKYKTYEEAELECLKKLIEIVKEQK
mgnify:FL=1